MFLFFQHISENKETFSITKHDDTWADSSQDIFLADAFPSLETPVQITSGNEDSSTVSAAQGKVTVTALPSSSEDVTGILIIKIKINKITLQYFVHYHFKSPFKIYS